MKEGQEYTSIYNKFSMDYKKNILGSSFGRRVKPPRQRIDMKTSYGRSVFDGFKGLAARIVHT